MTAGSSAEEYRRDEYLVSTDRSRLDLDVICGFIKESYWAKGIPREVVARSIENSFCFGLYSGNQQIGFARVITDFATYAYLADVFVLEAYRGRGLAKWLMQCIMEHPRLQGLRRWMLATRDAHTLYEQFGFRPLTKPDLFMELHDPEVYARSNQVQGD